jgi:hypothetical protein
MLMTDLSPPTSHLMSGKEEKGFQEWQGLKRGLHGPRGCVESGTTWLLVLMFFLRLFAAMPNFLVAKRESPATVPFLSNAGA